ncbi:E4 orf6/7 [Simian adenovirus 48]|uniref:E4 orf6/7 n=1 Tax=Simian adenovirus 48 TaxID=995021 RepID=A0A9W3I4Q6_9ADEN|nr:E4 orf6/7 [Simian adenovirus 48]
MAQRVRRYRCRLNPYQEYPLPPSENAPETFPCPQLPDCDMNTMHDMTTVDMEALMNEMENPPEAVTPVPGEPKSELEPEALDSCLSLSDVPDGFINVTDSRLACEEPVWILTPKSFAAPSDMQLFTAEKVERVVYKIKWKGGGGITTRVV